MVTKAKLIVLSPPNDVKGETNIVSALFAADLDIFHLRKPHFTKRQVSNYLTALLPEYIGRVVLHNHWSLADEFPVLGIHGPAAILEQKPHSRLSLSRSCHSLEEVRKTGRHFNYVFLSPVFDSISKPGYRSAFNLNDLKNVLTGGQKEVSESCVYALGGVSPANVAAVAKLGFTGAAVLGAVWHSNSPPLDSFIKLQKSLCSTHMS